MMNGYKFIIYIGIIMLGVVRHFLWIKGASIIGGLCEHSWLMLEGAQRVWTQSGVWHCISITSLSCLNPWKEIISIPSVILVWYLESKINRSGNITNQPCLYMLPMGINYKWTKVDVMRVHIISAVVIKAYRTGHPDRLGAGGNI